MAMIRCLIVDDEEPARELIRFHLSGLEDFEVVAAHNNALETFSFLQKHPVDLLFLDINMPKMSGLELLRSLKSAPRVILTTAYREHAVEAFELDVFDYLVKPITRERFMKAISKYLLYRSNETGVQEATKDDDAYLFLKVGRDQVRIFLKDIIYLEGLSDYIKVHTTEKSYVASEKLGLMETSLPTGSFTRIHKSFIVSLDKVTSFNADHVCLNGISLPLGRLFKANFLKMMPGKS
jgi:DNA-binding LytR/AlgR family response regulator